MSPSMIEAKRSLVSEGKCKERKRENGQSSSLRNGNNPGRDVRVNSPDVCGVRSVQHLVIFSCGNWIHSLSRRDPDNTSE